jgi:hypothetical protein
MEVWNPLGMSAGMFSKGEFRFFLKSSILVRKSTANVLSRGTESPGLTELIAT